MIKATNQYLEVQGQKFTIINEKPPVWDEVVKAFDLRKHKPIFAYGDCIYNPYHQIINQDLLVHEATHMRQQGGTYIGAKLWWIRYLADPKWIVEQEAEAYHEQYRFMCGITKDRNQQFRYLDALARQLSSEMYGNVVTYQEAINRIK